MTRYTRPTIEAIASAAADYHAHQAPAKAHTSMSYGVMPYLSDFMRAFDAYCPDGGFEFGNDEYVGTDTLNAAQLMNQLRKQLATHEAGEHREGCPGDGSCNGDGCPCEDAGSWCSCVLSILGFEWI